MHNTATFRDAVACGVDVTSRCVCESNADWFVRYKNAFSDDVSLFIVSCRHVKLLKQLSIKVHHVSIIIHDFVRVRDRYLYISGKSDKNL